MIFAADVVMFLFFRKIRGSLSEGLIRLPLLARECPFTGYGDLLMKMNQICDFCQMPRTESGMRGICKGTDPDKAWNPEWFLMPECVRERPEGILATMEIQILYRQHVSFQGFLHLEKQKVGFRSALELLFLIDDGLQGKTKVDDTGRNIE